MNKATKMWLGVGLLAAAGYLLWKNSKKKSFSGTETWYRDPKISGVPVTIINR